MNTPILRDLTNVLKMQRQEPPLPVALGHREQDILYQEILKDAADHRHVHSVIPPHLVYNPFN